MKLISGIPNTIKILPQITISINTTHLRVYMFTLYNDLVVLIPPQNMSKTFPQISGLENIDFVKVRHGDLAITINVVLLNFGMGVMDSNPSHEYFGKSLTNIIRLMWILYKLHHHTELQVHQKILGWPLRKCVMSSQLSVHGSPIFFHFYCQYTFIYIISTHQCIFSEHIC